MKNKSGGYMLFAVISAVVVIIIAFIMIIFAVSDNSLKQLEDYKSYKYSEYVDQSFSKKFNDKSGAQLYEAESAEQIKYNEVYFNKLASNNLVLKNDKEDCFSKYSITSNSDAVVALVINLSFTSKNNTSSVATNLFSVYVNNIELDVRNSVIKSSANEYDFTENFLCTFSLKNGINSIEFISSSDKIIYYMDYFVLISPEESNNSDKIIGENIFYFNNFDKKQIFEAEESLIKEGFVEVSPNLSGHYIVQSKDKPIDIEYLINSDQATRTILSLSINNFSSSEDINNLLEIYLNGEKISLNQSFITSEKNSVFNELEVSSINIIQGENILEIKGKSSEFFIDFLSLNFDINYSAINYLNRYEAEKMTLTGGQAIEGNVNASNGKYVAFNYKDSFLTAEINSKKIQTEHLMLRVSYWGTFSNLEDVISININDNLINLNSVLIKASTKNDDSKYIDFKDIYIGQVQLNDNKNSIIIKSISGDYNIDHITLYNFTFKQEQKIIKMQAENLGLSGCIIERNRKAEQGKIVSYNNSGTNLNLIANCESNIDFSLSFSISTTNKIENWDWFFEIWVNDLKVELIGKSEGKSVDWMSFDEQYICNITFNEGINSIAIVSKNGGYNIDYIKFTQK